jgi:deazaflavin-dependent oxidoreductase (nitroreductase family)
MKEYALRSRPTGALRLAFRLPMYLYDLGLGRLLGHRFLLLTHRGRKTGRVRRTVLEVIRYDPTVRESVVASGWGEKADWYRNLIANPALEVQTGRDRYAPIQRFLAKEEVRNELASYERRHPWAARVLAPLLGFRSYDEAASSLLMVGFRPQEGSERSDSRR